MDKPREYDISFTSASSGDELIEKMAERCGISQGHAAIIVEDLWREVKHYVQHLPLIRKGIVLSPVFRFEVDYFGVWAFHRRLKRKLPTSPHLHDLTEHYERVLKHVEKYDPSLANKRRRLDSRKDFEDSCRLLAEVEQNIETKPSSNGEYS